jgi:hypothetical protein
MVARLNRRSPLPQVFEQRVTDPTTQRAFDNVTQALEAAVDQLQPFVQFEAWRGVGAQGQLAFTTGWQNYTGVLNTYALAAYRKNPLARVELRGLVERSAGVATTLFTLPLGYRPEKTEMFAVYTSTGVGRIDVQSDGQVVLQAGGVGFVSLSAITFDTEA